MVRKIVLFLAAMTLPSLLLVTVAPGVAGASPIFPGTVTCNATNGAWGGTIAFSPPLRNGGTATHETFKVKATLGSSSTGTVGTGCHTSTTPPPLSTVFGKLIGKVRFVGAGSNNCTTIFGGGTLTPTVAAFKIKWVNPAGAPTLWIPPAFSVVGSPSAITITGGAVTGSFAPYATPNATLADPSWPGASGAVATGCATSTGLSSLSINAPSALSSGTW